MNVDWHAPQIDRLLEAVAARARFTSRGLSKARTGSIGRDGWIGRIHVINLDREASRWKRIATELERIGTTDADGGSNLLNVTRRFSAVDARYQSEAALDAQPDVVRTFSLAAQLFVQPDPVLAARGDAHERRIVMTAPEVAVAVSHIQVWRLIAEQEVEHALVLEDDAYLARGFAQGLDRVRDQLTEEDGNFDLLYLSYKLARGAPAPRNKRGVLFDPVTGMWQLSGYVLSRVGARRLLGHLPVEGPVDLWINHLFKDLTVHAASRPLIRQRPGVASSNLYSVLPVLSQLGSITRERPLLHQQGRPSAPVFVDGVAGSGHGAVAEALAMLGYRCCQDVANPSDALVASAQDGSSVFDAHINVAGLDIPSWPSIQRSLPSARFVLTVPSDMALDGSSASIVDELRQADPESTLVLAGDDADPWQRIIDLLGLPYPAHRYPRVDDAPRRRLTSIADVAEPVPATVVMRSDQSPWIVSPRSGARLVIDDASVAAPSASVTTEYRGGSLDAAAWECRDDTFPGNQAMFGPAQVRTGGAGITLSLEEATSAARQYASGAVASRQQYLYGRFSAELCASGVPGTVTGVFLHRSSPRQEIDIEILGRDPTRMLTNVYFNPGTVGDRLEYGYRGTPAMVELGFDASRGVHRYEIEWLPDVIRWVVDGRVVHIRHVWDPTPVPHQPMEFNVNLWPPRSRELAGRLRTRRLPATVEVTRLGITGIPAQCSAPTTTIIGRQAESEAAPGDPAGRAG